VADGQDAWEALGSGSFDLLVTDNRMPHLNGEELVLKTRLAGMTLPIIVAASDLEFFTDLHNHWLNVTLLRKPFSLVELTETIGGMLCAAYNVGWGQKEHNELFQNKNANQIF
jgi:DNA-binding response OmpR family regulator